MTDGQAQVLLIQQRLIVSAAAVIYGNAIGKFAVSIHDGKFCEYEEGILNASVDAAMRITSEVFRRLTPPEPPGKKVE